MPFRSPEPLGKRHRLDDFTCGEPALDEWLTRHARAAQGAGSAQVYVSTTDGETVAGYFALAAAEIAPQDAAARALKGQPATRPVPAVLLARLAVDHRFHGEGLGSALLRDALLRAAHAATEIGIRVVLVHAKHERAREFYLRYGFEPSPTDPLNLQLLMKDVLRLLAT